MSTLPRLVSFSLLALEKPAGFGGTPARSRPDAGAGSYGTQSAMVIGAAGILAACILSADVLRVSSRSVCGCHGSCLPGEAAAPWHQFKWISSPFTIAFCRVFALRGQHQTSSIAFRPRPIDRRHRQRCRCYKRLIRKRRTRDAMSASLASGRSDSTAARNAREWRDITSEQVQQIQEDVSRSCPIAGPSTCSDRISSGSRYSSGGLQQR